jgi:hypothetical protein
MNKPIREGFVADEAVPEPAAPAPPDAAPVEDVETWPVKVKLLHRPIRNHKNDEVRELLFREPTGADINRYGNPCRISADFEVVIDERKMTAIMSSLAGVLTPEIERLDPRDWNSCAYRLRRFFLPEPAAW